MNWPKAWVLDAHPSQDNRAMILWLHYGDRVEKRRIEWRPTIHVSATKQRLKLLQKWLDQPEIRIRFHIGDHHITRARLGLEDEAWHEVLALEISDLSKIRQLAEHIDKRGDWHHHRLYSIDSHLAQRFLLDLKTAPFKRVDSQLNPVEENDMVLPELNVIWFDLEFDSQSGFHTPSTPIKSAIIGDEKIMFSDDFIADIENKISEIDPDVIMTRSGDSLLFPALLNLAGSAGITLGRDSRKLRQRSKARTVFSYGQTLRKEAYHALSGRLHIDVRNSFIVREGGLEGLFELATMSGQSAQDISRLSPGSVISAIQMRTAMADGVLVPWKKNRPEDCKTAWELLHADRGGLYLDSKPGVHADVIELDFASLFPSIISTRNISPETLNCACCVPTKGAQIVPLNPLQAKRHFQIKRLAPLFPTRNEKALRTPGLSSHTCGRRQGFLGRVVGPIIERRRQIKLQIISKGDSWDQRQNALKWLLVTCFGYTGYRNARFGRIEAHEAICAWSRELLLDTISRFEQKEGKVLHAIVDCVWVSGLSKKSALNIALELSEKIGIPLEFEDHYHWIAFLPSRIHGAGSLTKYFAFGREGWKIRGIELRQHSTCVWIGKLQQSALEKLADFTRNGGEGIPDLRAQKSAFKQYLDVVDNFCKVPLADLVQARKIRGSKGKITIGKAALMRGQSLGHLAPAGTTVRFVVISDKAQNPLDRVRLAEELSLKQNQNLRADFNHYNTLAIRAIWSILAPFGWTETQIRNRGFGQSKLQM